MTGFDEATGFDAAIAFDGAAGGFRTGSRTHYGSVAERGPAPARPVLHSVVPAFPSPADRPTPPNRPTVPE